MVRVENFPCPKILVAASNRSQGSTEMFPIVIVCGFNGMEFSGDLLHARLLAVFAVFRGIYVYIII